MANAAQTQLWNEANAVRWLRLREAMTRAPLPFGAAALRGRSTAACGPRRGGRGRALLAGGRPDAPLRRAVRSLLLEIRRDVLRRAGGGVQEPARGVEARRA